MAVVSQTLTADLSTEAPVFMNQNQKKIWYCYDGLTDYYMVQQKTKYKTPMKSLKTSFNYHN